MKKNDEIILNITDVTSNGSGVGKYDGMAVFVPQSAVGDTVKVHIIKVNKHYCVGKIIEIIEPSAFRIPTDCDCFNKCGGCVFRHIDYLAESKIKQNTVEETMKRIGGINIPSEPILTGEHKRYRNKGQYPVNEYGETGFFAPHSHRIIPCSDCLLQPEEFALISEILKEFITEFSISVYSEETGKGLIRHLYVRRGGATKEIMVCLVINGETLPSGNEFVAMLKDKLKENLKSVVLNINKEKTNVILGKENKVIYGSGYITDILCSNKIRINPMSFYQVNREMAEVLYEKAKEYAEPENKSVIDLYCGAGTIGLSFAKKAKSIIGVEIVSQAVEDAKENAKINGIENARFICADASVAALKLKNEGISADVVILDPPRKGCDEELLSTVAIDFNPERIVYVSCDVATLSRDCKILETLGYKVKEYTPVDMFPRTSHVETVALLCKD